MKKSIAIGISLVVMASAAAGASVPVYAGAAPETDTSYVNIPTAGSKLDIEPTLILEPQNFSEITLSAPVRYASVILTPDKNMKVSLGGVEKTLESTYTTYLRGKFIPVVRLTSETVGAFGNWLQNRYTVSDIMAVSDDIKVIQTLYSDPATALVNTVYDLTAAELSSDRYAEWEHIGAANAAGCNILMYDGSDENYPVVAEYVEAMSKVAWARVESKLEAVGAIAAGSYGIVSDSAQTLKDAISVFKEEGFARAQYVAAHRGITKYANEQSLTAIAASVNEGSTHVEVDVQITADRRILICHNTDALQVTGVSGQYFANATFDQMRKLKLNNYSKKYNDTFPSLEEMIEVLQKSDVILIMELKLDAGSAKAVDTLQAIETIKEVMDKYPKMKGHWFTITFYSPYAEKMREVLPEIPVGYLGGAQSGKEAAAGEKAWGGGHTAMTNIAAKIAFLRKYNIVLDETMATSTNTTAQNYLARGYVQNTWTFEDLSHFDYKANIATSNKAEGCANLIKTIEGVPALTPAMLAAGEAEVVCRTYNGRKVTRTCKIIPVEETETGAYVLFHLTQEAEEGVSFGLYSQLAEVPVA